MADDIKQMRREAYYAAVAIAEQAFRLGRAAERLAGELQHQMSGRELHPVQASTRLRTGWAECLTGVSVEITRLQDRLDAWQKALPKAADLMGSWAAEDEQGLE